MGIVFQSFQLNPSFTALGSVTLPLEIAGKPDPHQKASDILAQVGLEHRQTHYPMQLSGGEQQRVAIARALVTTVFALVLGVLIALPLLHFQLKLPNAPGITAGANSLRH